nr:hypothetical protein [Tanacetum cinerariifolium]GEY90827.1 hypothetical protein [Tanacetum cinerariifolium]
MSLKARSSHAETFVLAHPNLAAKCSKKKRGQESKCFVNALKKSALKKNKRLMLDIRSFPFATMMTMTRKDLILWKIILFLNFLRVLQSHQMNPLTLSLSMGDEHLNTIPAMKSDKFIKSSFENLVPNPSESEGESECDVLACFRTFSNVLFDADYDFYSVDDQLLSDEDLPKEIYSNPLFEEEIIPKKIDQHHNNAESDLIESMLNHDSLKINSLFDEFAGELTFLKLIPPGIDETDCYPEEETHFTKRLLYDNSSLHPPEEFVSENSNAEIESFSPFPIPIKGSDSLMEEIDLSFTLDDLMPPDIEEDDYDSERDILILEEFLDNYSPSLPENESYHFDIPSSSRPPAKPLDGSTGTLNIKMMGKRKTKKDKIGTKPDENGKRGKARQCLSLVTVEKAEKRRNTYSKDQYWQILEDVFIQDKDKD